MNVRSVSPEGGGILLPFRGNRDEDPHEGDDPHARDGDEPHSREGLDARSREGLDPHSPEGFDGRSRDGLGSRHDHEARDVDRRDTEDATPPTVVHLTGRRRAVQERQGRPRWQRVGVVLAAAAVGVGGLVAASLTGVLPLSTERPVPRPAVSAPPTSASVEKGNLPAAYGLCKAFDRAAQRGDDIATAQAFRNLAHAAGGASRVSAYCAPFQRLVPGRAG